MSVASYLTRQIDSTPVVEVGIGGLTSMARVRETTTHKLDAPTTFLEDGSHVEDHIIAPPIEIQIDGEVSDTYLKDDVLTETTRRYLPEIGIIGGYLPPRTNSQIQRAEAIAVEIADKVRLADAVIKAGEQITNIFSPTTPSKGLMEQFVDTLDAYYQGKELITIDMPYRKYDNMIITSRVITKNNQTKSLQFKINARQVRFAETNYSAVSEQIKNVASGLNGQGDSETDKGSQEGTTVDRSTLYKGWDTLKGWLE